MKKIYYVTRERVVELDVLRETKKSYRIDEQGAIVGVDGKLFLGNWVRKDDARIYENRDDAIAALVAHIEKDIAAFENWLASHKVLLKIVNDGKLCHFSYKLCHFSYKQKTYTKKGE